MIEFTRDDDLKKPGTWMPTDNGKAVISCPKCGQFGSLDHEIASDGTVTPSLVCTTKDCGFHDWGKLIGWEKKL